MAQPPNKEPSVSFHYQEYEKRNHNYGIKKTIPKKDSHRPLMPTEAEECYIVFEVDPANRFHWKTMRDCTGGCAQQKNQA